MINSIIKQWFLSHRRALPWREDPSPYRVWVSEVMLQQTQVAVVIPYFERWMKMFPTIQALAYASFDTVLKEWEGLGYYARARNLHLGAQYIVAHFNGNLPSQTDKLAKIKGIGPYTQAAILCFAFHRKIAAVDGNVLRLLSRFYGIEDFIDRAKTRQKIVQLANFLLPEKEPWLVSEGLIELGGVVCKKTPLCYDCPLQSYCIAFKENKTQLLPRVKPRRAITHLYRIVAVIEYEGKILLQKEKNGKVMADLFEFPYLEDKNEDVKAAFEKALAMPLKYHYPLNKQEHSFTRYRAHLSAYLFSTQKPNPHHLWVEKTKVGELPFSSGHLRILKDYENFTH